METKEALLDSLDGSGSDAERETVSAIRRLSGDNAPREFLQHFRRSKKAEQRVACVYYAQPYARWNADALQIGLEGIEDRSKMVRFRAFELLAIAQNFDVLPRIQQALRDAKDAAEAEDAKACQCAILTQNHNCYRDRSCTGNVSFEWDEILPGSGRRTVVAGPCTEALCRRCAD
jgi:hypothetical protein